MKLSRDIKIEEDIAPECLECEAKPFFKYELGNIDSVDIETDKTSDPSSDFDGTASTIDDTIATSAPSIENKNLDELTYTPILRRSLRTNSGVPPVRYGSSDVGLVTQNRLPTSTVSQPIPLLFAEEVQFFQNDSCWSAMGKKITAINSKNVCTLTDIPLGRAAVKTTWVHSIKDRNGEPSPTFDARIVAKRRYAGTTD